MNYAVWVLLGVFVLLTVFTFRFQRITLSISRALDTGEDLTGELAPRWMMLLYSIDFILGLILAVLIFIQFSWIWLLVFLALSITGIALADVVSPLPSHAQCFKIIKRHLSHVSTNREDLLRGERWPRLSEQCCPV